MLTLTSRSFLPLFLAGSTLITSQAVAQTTPTKADCTLANALDASSYVTLTAPLAPGLTFPSEADEDQAVRTWSACRASALNDRLRNMPQLRTRLNGLREHYREMRAIEGELASIRAGGGTMYTHAIPRSYAPLETQLASLANLTSTSLGRQTSAHHTTVIQAAVIDHRVYVKILRAYQPPRDLAHERFDAKQWNASVDRYEKLGQSIMQTLGNRNDAATALGYTLLNQWLFAAEDPGDAG